MDLQRFGVKLFSQDSPGPDLPAFIPVFHSWIQGNALEDHLLVDVHDYGHVSAGPGILLVAHEGNYSWDLADNRPGLFYSRKQALAGGMEERLGGVFKAVLQAGQLLQDTPSLRVRFKTDELLLVANDRLHAPNTDQTFQLFRSALAPFLDRLLGGQPYHLVHRQELNERFAVTIHSSSGHGIGELLARVSDSRKRLIV